MFAPADVYFVGSKLQFGNWIRKVRFAFCAEHYHKLNQSYVTAGCLERCGLVFSWQEALARLPIAATCY